MRRLLLTLAVSIQPVAAATPASILILGDSLSSGYGLEQGSGWVALLQQRLLSETLPDHAVAVTINASISGDTTDSGLKRLPALLRRHQPGITVIELGGNDGLRGFPLAIIENNLATMIKLVRAEGSRVLLLGMRIPPSYGRRYSEAFHKIYLDLQKQYQLALVPFLLQGIGGHPKLMQADGIHPNALAQAMMLELVWPELNRVLKKQ
ncbi:MAG TPA: arylesterase [Gammaproteobacteria bacterium]|nr:arylesterase [Gammaproteobacteria bacterium]